MDVESSMVGNDRLPELDRIPTGISEARYSTVGIRFGVLLHQNRGSSESCDQGVEAGDAKADHPAVKASDVKAVSALHLVEIVGPTL